MPSNTTETPIEKADRLYQSEIATWLFVEGAVDCEELDDIQHADVIMWNNALRALAQ